MEILGKTTCPRCEQTQQQVLTLQAENDQLHAKIVDLQEQLAQAKRDSSNSHKPPSSDIVKPNKQPPHNDNPKHIGGQPGHPFHQRQPFTPEELTHTKDHKLPACPDCGGPVHTEPLPKRIVQQINCPIVPLTIEEHRTYQSWCPQCQKQYIAPLPPEIAHGGLLGLDVRTLIAYLKAACHASFSTIRKYLRDVLHIKVSRGYLAKVISQVSEALKESYQELLEHLPYEPHLNVDETGHPHNKENWWTWCFRAELYTLYRVDARRSADVLIEILGKEFRGVLGCDQFSAYHRFMRECDIRVQWCLAHLIREVKFLTNLPGQDVQAYGNRLRESLRELFAVIHQHEELSEAELKKRLHRCRLQILKLGTTDVPSNRYCENIAERLRKHGEGYFVFITTPGVHPTNNAAEQAIRFVVIDRYITQGTRSEKGQRWSERIWTVMASCVQQGKSVYEFLKRCIEAHWKKESKPSLLPESARKRLEAAVPRDESGKKES